MAKAIRDQILDDIVGLTECLGADHNDSNAVQIGIVVSVIGARIEAKLDAIGKRLERIERNTKPEPLPHYPGGCAP